MSNPKAFNWAVSATGLIAAIETIPTHWGLITNSNENIIRDEDNWYSGCCIPFNYMCVLLKSQQLTPENAKTKWSWKTKQLKSIENYFYNSGPRASVQEQRLVYMTAGVGHIISKYNLTGKLYGSYFHISKNIALSDVYLVPYYISWFLIYMMLYWYDYGNY